MIGCSFSQRSVGHIYKLIKLAILQSDNKSDMNPRILALGSNTSPLSHFLAYWAQSKIRPENKSFYHRKLFQPTPVYLISLWPAHKTRIPWMESQDISGQEKNPFPWPHSTSVNEAAHLWLMVVKMMKLFLEYSSPAFFKRKWKCVLPSHVVIGECML